MTSKVVKARGTADSVRFYIKSAGFNLLPQYIKIGAMHDYKIFQQLLQRTKSYVCNLEDIHVLDVGCGIRAPFTLLFHSLGIRVVGIDINVLTREVSITKYRRILARQGFEGLLMRLATDWYINRVYYRELRRIADFPLDFKEIDLREMDVTHTTFGEEFDLVVSNATFEHLKDVKGALAEINRIMKVNALLYAEIHLFPSLTGGHNTLWSNPDTQHIILGRVAPWDHLRKQRYPIDPSLNRMRENEYYKLFSERFNILEWITEYKEPECYLTPELASELNKYPREELLKRAVVVIARKV
jgi:SAM-dependent methyltransferase